MYILLIFIFILIFLTVLYNKNFYFKTICIVLYFSIKNKFYSFFQKNCFLIENKKNIMIYYKINNQFYTLKVVKPILSNNVIFEDENGKDVTELVKSFCGPNFQHKITPKDIECEKITSFTQNNMHVFQNNEIIKRI